MHKNQGQRLTSWKEIAAHLGRDVRTVLRWEKERGLPIHRVPGVTGRVVFAYKDELDGWARGHIGPSEFPASIGVPVPEPVANVSTPATVIHATRARASHRSRRWIVAAGVLCTVGLIGWRAQTSRVEEGPLTVAWAGDGIAATGADGVERWRYKFPATDVIGRPTGRAERVAEILGGPEPGVLTATTARMRVGDSVIRSGELVWIAPNGVVRRSLSIEDRLTFGAVTYGAPWAITDFRVDPSGGPRRVAVSAHHYEWWPSIVTVFDEGWHRRGTFVNAGWIERMQWISRNRLLVAGFSNALDGGMLALLDPDALDGQSPAPSNSTFFCASCGPASPLRYVVLPRSEVNRVSASPFNRVVLAVKGDSLLARTMETPGSETGGGPADALYELTPSLEVTRARFSDRYWEMHHQLESQGKITHTREQCPDRDGPREIRVWEPASGWTTMPIAR
jgi:hypothetical protein